MRSTPFVPSCTVGVGMAMGVGVAVTMAMTMAVTVIVAVVMTVTMIMAILMSMSIRVRVGMGIATCILFLGMHLGVCSSLVLQPELRDRVSNYASQGTQFLERVANAVLDICGQR